MNTWWYRIVGTVGMAGGLLLGSPAAQAGPGDLAPAAQAGPGGPAGPQPVTGVVGDLIGPADGLTGPLGGSPTTGLMPGDDVVPGVVDGPYVVPPPAMETGGAEARGRGDRRVPSAVTGAADELPAASVVSPLDPAPAGGLPLDPGGVSWLLGGALPAGDLLSGGGVPVGDLLSGGGDAGPATLPATAGMPGGGTVVPAPRAARTRAFSDGRPVAGEDTGRR